jgi:CRP-like cAMP-binding protein
MEAESAQPIVSARAIRESPLGVDLNDTQCRVLADCCTALGLEAGMMLLEEGHSDNTLYVVSSGTLEVIKPSGGGESVPLQLLHEGDMAGILGFVDGVAHSAAIRAQNNCELIALDRKDLEGLIAEQPQLVFEVMRAVVRAAHRILTKMNNQFVEMSNYINKQHGRY